MVLRNFALLAGYYFANFTKPLVATGSLENGAINWLYNTLNFWVDVSRFNEKSSEKRMNAYTKTALVHSASRLMIEKKEPNWEVEKYGIPINYADIIATNIAFTINYLNGLDQLNFHFTKEEKKKGYFIIGNM